MALLTRPKKKAEQRYDWLDAIMERLFAAETRRIDKMIESLTERNSEAKGKTTYGFMHMGQNYIPKCNRQIFGVAYGRDKQSVPSLALGLSQEASMLMSEKRNLENDESRIRQLLSKMIYHAIGLQQLRDSLPECLIQFVDQFKGIPRTQECTWLIKDDARTMRDYEKILPKIEFYSVTALLY